MNEESKIVCAIEGHIKVKTVSGYGCSRCGEPLYPPAAKFKEMFEEHFKNSN